jgi:hypothetical protein
MEAYKKNILEYDSIKTAIGLEKLDAFEEGLEIGIKEGIKIGREKVRKGLIKHLLQKGAPIELLSKCTEYTVEQMENISKDEKIKAIDFKT